MLQDGPSMFAAAAADCFPWANLIFQDVLLMLYDRPIVLQQQPPIVSLGPI